MRLITRLLAALAVLALLRGCDELRSAPAPFPRTARPVPVAGHYDLDWHGTRYLMTLSPCGSYCAVSPCGKEVWRGTWRVEAGILHVSETMRLDSPPTFSWSLPLAGGRVCRVGTR
jgi:hypothetical protein